MKKLILTQFALMLATSSAFAIETTNEKLGERLVPYKRTFTVNINDCAKVLDLTVRKTQHGYTKVATCTVTDAAFPKNPRIQSASDLMYISVDNVIQYFEHDTALSSSLKDKQATTVISSLQNGYEITITINVDKDDKTNVQLDKKTALQLIGWMLKTNKVTKVESFVNIPESN